MTTAEIIIQKDIAQGPEYGQVLNYLYFFQDNCLAAFV